MPSLFVSAVIAAAGSSRRFGSDKLMSDLAGMPLIAHTMQAFQFSWVIDEIIIVCREESIETMRRLAADHNITKISGIVPGGFTRAESVSNGVYACSKKAKYIAVHDGARPLVKPRLISDALHKARRYGSGVPCIPVKSTIKRVTGAYIAETPKRKELYEAQTPQIFDSDLLKAALAKGSKRATDEASMLEALGAAVYISAGDYTNIKVTTREDLIVANALFSHLNNLPFKSAELPAGLPEYGD